MRSRCHTPQRELSTTDPTTRHHDYWPMTGWVHKIAGSATHDTELFAGSRRAGWHGSCDYRRQTRIGAGFSGPPHRAGAAAQRNPAGGDRYRCRLVADVPGDVSADDVAAAAGTDLGLVMPWGDRRVPAQVGAAQVRGSAERQAPVAERCC